MKIGFSVALSRNTGGRLGVGERGQYDQDGKDGRPEDTQRHDKVVKLVCQTVEGGSSGEKAAGAGTIAGRC